MAVAINVREIDAHGIFACVAHGQSGDSAEPSLAVIDPNPVGGPIIIANIKVRESVAVEIAESCGQPPIQRLRGQWLACFIEKCALGPGDWTEMSFAIVEIKHIGFAVLERSFVYQNQP